MVEYIFDILKYLQRENPGVSCDNFLTSYVAVFLNEQLLKLRSETPWSFPGALNQGCLRETAQLQTNIGEQGSVSMFEDIRLYSQRINNGLHKKKF